MAAELPDDVAAQADALYGLTPGEFVTARGELVKALRADGRKADAAVVAKLPKPSLPAWAVNQVVRTQCADVRTLWAAGDAVVAAQEAVLAGDAGRDVLRSAVEAERTALAPLAQAARGLMTAPGRFLAETAAQEVVETLHAAALDPEARADVEAARLARPLRMAGMGAVAGGATRHARRVEDTPAPTETEPEPEAPAAAQAEPGAPPPPPAPDPADAARRKDARAAAARADREAEAARRRLARAERDRAAAEERVDRARARLRDAEDALEAAEDEVDERRTELSRAEDAADAARAEADD